MSLNCEQTQIVTKLKLCLTQIVNNFKCDKYWCKNTSTTQQTDFCNLAMFLKLNLFLQHIGLAKILPVYKYLVCLCLVVFNKCIISEVLFSSSSSLYASHHLQDNECKKPGTYFVPPRCLYSK